MDPALDEARLVAKLVLSAHLSVPERKALPGRTAKASLVLAAVADALRSGRPIHAWWPPDDSFQGCELTYRGDPGGRLTFRYRGIEGESERAWEHGSVEEAAAAVVRELRRAVGDKIDGVPVDWSA